jgi:poly-gamma-glutamate system protein
LLLSVFLVFLRFGVGFGTVSAEEERLWNRVRSGQRALWETQASFGVSLSRADDGLETGFIGTEWSDLSTTLGEIGAKRTSCDPLWALRCLDWFDDLGIKRGERVAIYSSASFPGLLFSVLAAAEERELDILLVVSLGSSSWGANRVEFPWPMMYKTLADGGFIGTRPAFCTPGGAGERGDGIAPELMERLRVLSMENGVPFVVPRDLADAVRFKFDALLRFGPRLLINIGGSNANLGRIAADIPPGLLRPDDADKIPIGDGVIAKALHSGIPVLHLLNMRRLALENDIPWDTAAFSPARSKSGPLAALVGLTAFAAAMIFHKRWEWKSD